MTNQMSELSQALVGLNEEKFISLIKEKIAKGKDPMEVIQECNIGMVEIGRLFEIGEYFISELVMSGEILRNGMAHIEPLLDKRERVPSKGTVVIGTVKDDIHDIGKNIVITLLKGAGYEVVDLGVDVRAEKFVEAVSENNAKVLGLSALLNTTFPRMKEVVEALEGAGVRDTVTVIIGGTMCTEEVRKEVGADHYANNASKGVRICKKVYGE